MHVGPSTGIRVTNRKVIYRSQLPKKVPIRGRADKTRKTYVKDLRCPERLDHSQVKHQKINVEITGLVDHKTKIKKKYLTGRPTAYLI